MTSLASEKDVESFLARQTKLLAQERAAEVEQTTLLLTKCSHQLLEKKGLALGGLSIARVNIGLGGQSLVELERPLAHHVSITFPPHLFRTGDIALLEPHMSGTKAAKKTQSDAEEKGIEGVIYSVSDTRIVLAVESESEAVHDLPDKCRIVKLANSATHDRMEKTINTLRKMFCPPSDLDAPMRLPQIQPLHRVLLGTQELGKPDSTIATNLTWFNDSLNASQKAAITFALQSPEVACIWGPPGTGKTTALVELILQMVSQDLRVLVCGASNLSVDNILERLSVISSQGENQGAEKIIPKLQLTRVSHPARTLPSLLRATLDYKAFHSDEAELARDCKNELEAKIASLTGKAGASKGAKGGRKPRLTKEERKKGWDDVKQLRKEYRKRETGVVTSIVRKSNVVLATCHSAGARQIINERFDVVIIDEATQALEAVCWVPILKAKKLVLAGDPMQLPPTILSRDGDSDDDDDVDSKTGSQISQQGDGEVKASSRLKPPQSLSTTLFVRLEKMYGPPVKRMLEVQYRMNTSIAAYPSMKLYQAKLVSHKSVASHLLTDLPNVTEKDEIDADVLSPPLVFFDTAGLDFFEKVDSSDPGNDEGSKYNENEAEVVSGWVRKLILGGILPDQIALITPYQAQVRLLASLLRPEFPEMEIGTVDGMQGREKEVVILSLVRSNNKREVGFLKDKRRLNVGMTRAKRQLCVVGDSDTVKNGGPFLSQWMSWLEAEADVRYAGDN